MHELTAANAADYLLASGLADSTDEVAVRALAGGVSNAVLLVSLPNRWERFVLKQARGRLNVQAEWLASVERIWREVEVLSLCGSLVPVWKAESREPNGGAPSSSILPRFEPCVPEVLWQDRANYAFAMAAAPEAHQTWKEMLLSGQTTRSLGVAVAAGQLLGRLHAGTWNDRSVAGKFDDRTFFDQLRLDPYYRHVAHRHADLAPQLGSLIDSVSQHRHCLVHGDFSPKNLLVWPGRVMLIDCEVGHYGDPAFDLGFFLTHLVLKALWSGPRRKDYLALANAFWHTYRSALASSLSAEELAALESRAMFHLAGCLLARIDGKSPVDYLTAQQQDLVRRIAIAWLHEPPPTWTEAHQRLLAAA